MVNSVKYKAKQHGYKVLRVCNVEDVLPFTGLNAPTKLYAGHMVKMTSLRYQCFVRNIKCACCGIEGSIMLLELPKNGNRPHFNLYAKREGELVQMTKDHIDPKSNNGPDCISNMQTLCCRCNELKGNHTTKLKRLREIQNGVQTVYTVLFHDKTPMDSKFATSPQGIRNIARQYAIDSFGWPEDVEVQVNMQLLKVTMKANQWDSEFDIQPLGRV